ncbi:MAG: hypothetical protein J1E58_04935 [Prevotella sp.]|nr:hypothetical protein [Prevotella sp.]
MRIKPEQEAILSNCKCIRVRNSDRQILSTIVGAKVNLQELSNIIDLFRHPKHIEDELNGHLASYLVLAPDNTVLMFFSLRCGELFKGVDNEKIEAVRAANEVLLTLSENSQNPIGEEKRNQAIETLKRIIAESGLTIDDISQKKYYFADEKIEPDKLVSRVLKVFPGVELKFYGTNEAGKEYWKTTKLHHKMGLTLYWRFVVPKLEELQDIAGCQYMYLFAADREADGHLVTYYRTALHINANHFLSSNKPQFDYTSVFLYQDITELKKQRDYFFETFNDTINQDAV